MYNSKDYMVNFILNTTQINKEWVALLILPLPPVHTIESELLSVYADRIQNFAEKHNNLAENIKKYWVLQHSLNCFNHSA